MVEISLDTNDKQIRDRLLKLRETTSDYGRSRLVVGTNVQYMREHQLGIGVPKREFLGFNEADQLEVVNILDDAIQKPKPGGAEGAMKNAGEYMLLQTDSRFEREIAPDGTPWQPNSAFTLRRKSAMGRILKVLQSTGHGRASIRYQVLKR